jgi:predicted Zn-dependent peptidase
VTIVGAAGALNHAEIVEAAAAKFATMPTQAVEAAAPARYVGGDLRINRRLEQAHIVIGFEGLSYLAPAYYALQVFANAAGGGMSSRLFQEVREKRGLAYAVNAFHWGYTDTGLFGFYAGTSKAQVRELIPVALECLAEAAQDLTDAEIDRAKAQMKVSLLTALESATARSEQVARQILAFGRVLTREEILQNIDGLTASDIRAAGAAALRTPPTVAAVGPVSKVHTPDRVRELVGQT